MTAHAIKHGDSANSYPGTIERIDGKSFIVLGNGTWFDMTRLTPNQRVQLELDIRKLSKTQLKDKSNG